MPIPDKWLVEFETAYRAESLWEVFEGWVER